MKKKFSEEQLWYLLFAIPGLILGRIANVNEIGVDAIISSALYGGISVAFGVCFYLLIKKQDRSVKVISVLGLYFISFFAAILLNDKLENDIQIVQEDWKTQSIGSFNFASPENLEPLNFELEEGLMSFYKSLKSYSDINIKRLTVLYKGELLIDSLDLIGAFEGSLSGLLKAQGFDLSNISLEYLEDSPNVVSAISHIDKGQDTLYGYGCMYFDYPKLESVFLLPRRKGFSLEYINKFHSSVKIE